MKTYNQNKIKKTASVGICLQRMIGEGRKEESEALNRKFLICRV